MCTCDPISTELQLFWPKETYRNQLGELREGPRVLRKYHGPELECRRDYTACVIRGEAIQRCNDQSSDFMPCR